MSVFKQSVGRPSPGQMTDVPIVFLSFDEPNAENHWQLLKQTVPHNHIARVHGVVGFDAAHKAAAEEFPNSEYIITVDADNQVDADFFKKPLPSGANGRVSFTWAGRQIVNGLMYGNGGLKMWARDHLINMRSHETATEERDAVDFCWDETRYKELTGCYSDVYTNASPYQAFRVGFREGVKLSMDQGQLLAFDDWPVYMHAANFQRLLTWMTIGADVKNGIWSILGSRLAVKLLQYDSFDHVNIRNYAWFSDFFKEFSKCDPLKYSKILGREISDGIGFNIPNFDSNQSYFLKMLQLHPSKPLTYDDVKWQTNLKMYGWFNE